MSWRTAAKIGTFGVAASTFLYYASDSRAGIHKLVTFPLLRFGLDAESAHRLSILLARSGGLPADRGVDDPCLKIKLFGKELDNPVGLAAGFDKNGEAVDGLFNLGFGMVEIGSITPHPQVSVAIDIDFSREIQSPVCLDWKMRRQSLIGTVSTLTEKVSSVNV